MLSAAIGCITFPYIAIYRSKTFNITEVSGKVIPSTYKLQCWKTVWRPGHAGGAYSAPQTSSLPPPQESHTHSRPFGSRTEQNIQHEVPEKVILSTDSAGKEIVWRLGLCPGLRWGSLQCCPRLPCQLPPFQELHPLSTLRAL